MSKYKDLLANAIATMAVIALALCLSILILLVARTVFAEPVIKAGYYHTTCENIDDGIAVEASYSHDFIKQVNLSMGCMVLGAQIKDVGFLTSVVPNIAITIPVRKAYIGAGVGYAFNYCEGMDCDEEKPVFVVLGYEIKESGSKLENCGIELKYMVCDIDLETGIPGETPIEGHSRLDGAILTIGKRF